MVRRILGVVVALAVAMLTVSLVEIAGHAIFPPPPGTDMNDPAQVARIVDVLPIGAKLWVMLAWFAGVLAGSWAGLTIARWRALPWIVAGAIVAAGIYTMTLIPHPWWMVAGGLLLPPLAAWLALRLKPVASFRA